MDTINEIDVSCWLLFVQNLNLDSHNWNEGFWNILLIFIRCRPAYGVRPFPVDHLRAGPQVWINQVPSYRDQSRTTLRTPWIRRSERKRCKKLTQVFWDSVWTQRIGWTWERYKLSRIKHKDLREMQWRPSSLVQHLFEERERKKCFICRPNHE